MEEEPDYIIALLKNSNVKEVERATGIPADRMYKWLKAKGSPKFEDAHKLLSYFEGRKKKSAEPEEVPINDPIDNPSINREKQGVPYFDIDFVGGFDLVFNSNQVKPSFYIDFLPFNDADYWVNVSGKSMGPLIAHGDIVALKEVADWKRFLLEGEIYAIITDNGFRTIKMIGKGPDKDHYMLIPYNKGGDYQPQEIPKQVITHVFRVKGAIKKFF
jgi:SOS-response transcriptional repressor LexA